MGLRSLMLAVQMTPPAVDELMRRIESGSVEIGAMLPKKSLSHVVRFFAASAAIAFVCHSFLRARRALRCSRWSSNSASCSG